MGRYEHWGEIHKKKSNFNTSKLAPSCPGQFVAKGLCCPVSHDRFHSRDRRIVEHQRNKTVEGRG